MIFSYDIEFLCIYNTTYEKKLKKKKTCAYPNFKQKLNQTKRGGRGSQSRKF